MYQRERIDTILKIIHENGYVTVKHLCEVLDYSKATINRDLNLMQQQKLIERSYGGVELTEKKDTPLPFRYHKMKNEKKRICKAAADLVKDDDTIFIDSSSTTEYLAPFLTDKKNITVITSNIAIVSYLSDYSNIKTICLGGEIFEPPSMLGGDLCVQNAMLYKADKVFFSTHSISENGELGGSGIYNLILNVMAKNSDKIIYLADRSKINLRSSSIVMTMNDIDTIVIDYKFSDDIKSKYPHIEFIEVK